MGEQYFSEQPASDHAERSCTIDCAGRALAMVTDAGVFSKGHLDPGTALLLSALPETLAGRALDLGCGWGAVGAWMAARWPGAEVALTDINARATALAERNLRANGLRAAVYQGDGLSAVPGALDLIAVNPPIRAGKAVVYRLFEEAVARLVPGGTLFVVIRKQQGADSAQRFLSSLMGKVEIVERGGGYRVIRGTV